MTTDVCNRRRIRAVAASLGLVLLGVAAPASASAPAANALQRWASTNGGGSGAQNVTQAQAVADAQAYDLIVALQRTFPPYLAAMRKANPSLEMAAYLNGAYVQSDQGPTTGAFPASWYATSASGDYVRSKSGGNWLMDVSNKAWGADRSKLCAAYIAASGYDGCYLDMLGSASVDPGYVTSPPVNPSTGQAWTIPGWIGATAGVAAAVKAGNPGRLIVGNGLTNGTSYVAASQGPSAKLIGPLDGANAQGFVRSETSVITSYRNSKRWKADVDMLVDAGRRGKSVLAMTKIGVSATAAQIKSIERYSLATFLLGTDGHQFFFFDPDGIDGAVADDFPDLHVVVGAPAGGYVSSSRGTYLRRFSSGLAVVNPTGQRATVQLGGTYTDLDGTSESAVTLAPHSGMVFTKALTATAARHYWYRYR